MTGSEDRDDGLGWLADIKQGLFPANSGRKSESLRAVIRWRSRPELTRHVTPKQSSKRRKQASISKILAGLLWQTS